MNKIRLTEEILRSTIAESMGCLHVFVHMLANCDDSGTGMIKGIEAGICDPMSIIEKQFDLSWYEENNVLHYSCAEFVKYVTIPKSEKKEPNNNAETIKQIIDYLNEKSGRSFDWLTPEFHSLINGRLKEKFRGKQIYLKMFQQVIDLKCKQWKDTDMHKYLRPQTLFNRSKFHQYLDECVLEHNKKEKGSNNTVVATAKI